MLDEQLKQKINEYLAAIKAGDTSAINMLYDLIGGHLLLIARSYLDDKNSDEDIVAEVFRRIGVSIKSFDPARDGYNWLYKITKNAALSHNKSERRHKTVNIDKVANTIKVESFTDKADIWMDFCAALDKLDESDIELFKLRFIDDLPQKQLARKLHITESAVSQRVNKILKELSKIYKKDYTFPLV